MSAADDVAEHIHNSLLDLRRRLDADTALKVTRAVLEGAQRALHDLGDDEGCESEGGTARPTPSAGLILFGDAKH